MRISGGKFKGREILTVKDNQLRPTTERVRESLFSTLFSMGCVENRIVLDLFAGTGALGIEALSRGADRGIFVEKNSATAKVLESNLKNLGLDGMVIKGDVLKIIPNLISYLPAASQSGLKGCVDLVFADPPYQLSCTGVLIEQLCRSGMLSSEAVLVFERRAVPKGASCKNEFCELESLGVSLAKQRTYGKTELLYFAFDQEKVG